MPVLAAYIGYSGVSTALQKNDGMFAFQRFPYPYSAEIFSSFCNEKEYYKQVLELIAKENKAKLSDFEILITGFTGFPVPELEVKLTVDVKSLMVKHDEHYIVLVDSSIILTPESTLSNVPIDFVANNEYYANLSVYPQLITRDYSDQVNIDGLTIGKCRNAGIVLTSDKPIIFSGDRFAQRDYEPVFKYALALDLFTQPGFYYVKLDRYNSIILSQLIKENDPACDIDLTEHIENVGTFVLAPGSTEILVTTETGTGQFFDIKKDTVFALPLDKNIKSRISVKNRIIGNLEGEVNGGTLGLLVDTREDRSQLIADVKIMNVFMREIEEVVRGI